MNEQKAFTIMMKDIEVMRVDFAALIYEVINEKYIPYPIKGKLQPLINPANMKSEFNITKFVITTKKNKETHRKWTTNRD